MSISKIIPGDGNWDDQREDDRCRRDLFVTDPRVDKMRIERTKGTPLQVSYCWILENADFRRWRYDEQTRLLCITGDPGTGKTMLLCGIIDELEKSTTGDSLLSFFFCQATDSRLNNAVAVLRGLTYLLVDQQPSLISHVRKIYDGAGKYIFESVNALSALSEILANILKDSSLTTTYLIIDALDECEMELPQLIDFIVQQSSASPRVKWIVSSRNRFDTKQRLREDELQATLNLELKQNSKEVRRAVDAYIDHRISKLVSIQHDRALQGQVRDKMQQNANGSFLWVSLVIKELEKQSRSWDVISVLDTMPTHLEEVYGRMMKQIQRLNNGTPELCRLLLSTVTAAYRPLHLRELGLLSELPEDVSSDNRYVARIVSMCGSFLTVQDGKVYIIHQSAKEFLLTSAINTIFPSGVKAVHSTMFSRSVQVMSETLYRDIYCLRDPGIPIEQVKPPDPDPLAAAWYSCVYWVDHLCDSDSSRSARQIDDIQDDGKIHSFLKDKYLYWLEALSLVGKTSECVVAITSLQSMANEGTRLHAFIHDANRFLLYNRSMIEETPLQTYYSALVFAPVESLVRNYFKKEMPHWILSTARTNWGALLQTLEGHSEPVTRVVFSPDGSKLASGSYDKTVRLWNVRTGKVEQTLEGHSNPISSAVFSPNGSKLASGSYDKTVRLWNVHTGEVEQTLEGHSDWVSCAVFSPDSSKLASGSYDKTVRVWNVHTGEVEQTLEGHSGPAICVVFSPDGSKLASGSYDKTVRVWNVNTGQVKQILNGHLDWISSVVFSPSSSKLVSGSYDETVRVWNVCTGNVEQTLKGHSGPAIRVVFSPDGSKLASGSYDKTVRVWNVGTGQVEQTLEGHSSPVSSVVFSPDGSKLASGSYDKTVRVWNVHTGEVEQTLEGHSGPVIRVVFSHDGSKLASGSYDKTVRMWNVGAGQIEQMLDRHMELVSSVVFSPDGSKLASGSYDKTVRVWNVRTGKVEQILDGHSDRVTSVVFSLDGGKLASGSYDKTVRVWNVRTGQVEQTLEGSRPVSSVVFSPDGGKLASGSYDKTVCVWNVRKGQVEQTLEGSRPVSSVVFSPDGSKLASGSYDKTVCVWNVRTKQVEQILEGHSSPVSSVIFSPDGSKLAGSDNEVLRVWNVGTGQVEQILADYMCPANTVVFSPDGSKSNSFYCIDMSGCWVTRNRSRVLYLPLDHRPGCIAIEGSSLAIGAATGLVTIIMFYAVAEDVST